MKDLLNGGGPNVDTAEAHRRWQYLVRLFFLGVNRENGTIQILPEPGALLDQGHLTMQVWTMLQGMFIEHVNEQMKNQTAKVH